MFQDQRRSIKTLVTDRSSSSYLSYKTTSTKAIHFTRSKQLHPRQSDQFPFLLPYESLVACCLEALFTPQPYVTLRAICRQIASIHIFRIAGLCGFPCCCCCFSFPFCAKSRAPHNNNARSAKKEKTHVFPASDDTNTHTQTRLRRLYLRAAKPDPPTTNIGSDPEPE